MKKYKKLALAAIFVFGGFAATAAEAACTLYFKNTANYSAPSKSTTYPLTWTQNCSPGNIGGTFTSLSPAVNMTYSLEKQSSGVWQEVRTGSSISYPSSPTGNYRFKVVNNNGSNSGTYTLNYSRP